MILPTKHITEHEALIGAGGLVLEEISKPVSLSHLWENVKSSSSVQTYERFILTLDMLHIVGAIEIEESMIVRIKK